MLEAQRLLHQARLDAAIDLIGPASAQRDETAALDALDALGREPWSDIVGIAQILRAALTGARGEREQAETLMADALTAWERQQATAASRLAPEVERDVADIWRLIVEDTGAWWRGSFVWSMCVRFPRFRVVNPEVTVQLPGGVPRRETVYPAFAASDVLFMTTEQMAMLTSAVNAIYGPRTGLPPESASLVSRELMDLLAASLPRQGCGLRVAVYRFEPSPPVVGVVRFTDEAPTRAEVGLLTGSSSGSLFLEKHDGVWRVTDVAPGGVC